jgi:hypothetical protein
MLSFSFSFSCLNLLILNMCSFHHFVGEEAEQLEGSDEKIEESCRLSAKVRFLDDIEDMGERSDLSAIQVTTICAE